MIQVLEADLTLPEHASALIQLMDEYARDPMGGGNALSQFAKDNLVSELKKRETAHVILAFVDGKPAGLVTCLEGFSTFACRPLLNVHDAVVSAEYRGRGWGSPDFVDTDQGVTGVIVRAAMNCCS